MGAAGVLGGMLGGKLLGGGASFLDKIFSGNLALLEIHHAEGNASAPDVPDTGNVLAGAGGGGNAQKNKKLLMKIPINPNEVTLDSSAVDMEGNNITDVVSGTTLLAKTKFPTCSLTVTLDLDETRTSSCFQDSALDFLNPLGAVQGGVRALTGLLVPHTVLDEVNALLSLMRTREYRTVTFRWSDFSFRGTVDAVQAVYTMFDTKGNPVRAKVLLRIRKTMDMQQCKEASRRFNRTFNRKYNLLDKAMGSVGL